MLALAFPHWPMPVVIDEQEVRRDGDSYAIDTLRALRAELGPEVSIAMALGADQLLNLHTWRDWLQLFDLAHLCFATRPGFALQGQALDPAVAEQLARRLASPAQLKASAHGLAFIATNLAVDVASNGVEAVALAAELDPDVILMDLRMPGLDGIGATQQIVKAGRRARILVLTTFDDDELVLAAPLPPRSSTAGGSSSLTVEQADSTAASAAIAAISLNPRMVLLPWLVKFVHHAIRVAQHFL